MTAPDLKIALAGGKRTLCLRLARRLAAMGGHPSKGRKVAEMVSNIVGRPMSKDQSFRWLLVKYDEDATMAALHTVRKAIRRAAKAPDDGFYRSREWRSVRFDALKAADGRCVLCGRSQREHAVILHVDHIKPRSRWPDLALTLSNLQVLCEDCNLGKSNRDDTDWRPITNDAPSRGTGGV